MADLSKREMEILIDCKIDHSSPKDQPPMQVQKITGLSDLEQLLLHSLEEAYAQQFKAFQINIVQHIDLDLCITAEDLFCTYYEWFTGDENRRRYSEMENKRFLFKMVQQWLLEEQHGKEDPQTLYHLYLSQITRRTLARTEFEMAFASHPSFEPSWKELLWWHNTHCPIFFSHTFQEILDSITVIKEGVETLSELANLAHYILKMISIIEENRTHFEFCAECRLNDPQHCKFWEDVTFTINQCDFTPEETHAKETLKKYFTELEIPSKCPINFENCEENRE